MKTLHLADAATFWRYFQKTVVREVDRVRKGAQRSRMLSFHPAETAQGRVLLSYVLDPFLAHREHKPIAINHTNHWESFQIAQTFLDLGYDIDVIDFRNNITVPLSRDYDIFIDIRFNMERLAPLLAEHCLRLMHIDYPHIIYARSAEAARLLSLQQRRGVNLLPRYGDQPINYAIEYADHAICLGNEFTINTYRYAGKQIDRVPFPVLTTYPWPQGKDFSACRRHFLWMSSWAFVHKGLDLVLEAFRDMPDYHLTVAGPMEREPDFQRAYHDELYNTPNIHTIGWLDVTSPAFAEIASGCVGVIFASAGESGCGSVLSAMHAGLIPVVSYETSVDVEDFGTLLSTNSIDGIKAAIQQLSDLPLTELEDRARRSWQYVRAHHTRERFAAGYRSIVETILQESTKASQERSASALPLPLG